MPRDDSACLLDMLLAVRDALSFTENLSFEDFLRDRRAKPEEPLPDLVTNGYCLPGHDWSETAKEWKERGSATPPVMITVANRTETAARIKHAFDRKRVRIDELCDPGRTQQAPPDSDLFVNVLLTRLDHPVPDV